MVTKWQHLLYACTGLHYGDKAIAFIEHLDTWHRQVFSMIAKGQHLLYIRTLCIDRVLLYDNKKLAFIVHLDTFVWIGFCYDNKIYCILDTHLHGQDSIMAANCQHLFYIGTLLQGEDSIMVTKWQHLMYIETLLHGQVLATVSGWQHLLYF